MGTKIAPYLSLREARLGRVRKDSKAKRVKKLRQGLCLD